MPVAVNCGLVKFATVELAGVTVMDCKGFVTVRDVEPVMLEGVAEIVAEIVTMPGARPVANPPGELMVAMVLFEDCQVAVEVRS